MQDSNYTKVFSGNSMIVQRIFVDLEEEDIRPVIKDEAESGRLAGFGASIQDLQEVYVHNDELEKALSILENITKDLAS